MGALRRDAHMPADARMPATPLRAGRCLRRQPPAAFAATSSRTRDLASAVAALMAAQGQLWRCRRELQVAGGAQGEVGQLDAAMAQGGHAALTLMRLLNDTGQEWSLELSRRLLPAAAPQPVLPAEEAA